MLTCECGLQSEDVALLRQEMEKGQKFLGRVKELLNDCQLFANEKAKRKDVR